MTPLRLSLGGSAPALLHPPRAEAWWWVHDAPAWYADDRLWVVRSGDVWLVPIEGPLTLLAEPDGVLVWNTKGDLVVVSEHVTWLPVADGTRTRHGADCRATRLPGCDWVLQYGHTDVPLPEGAARARDLVPFLRGEGVCWMSDGYLYRQVGRQAPRALTEPGSATQLEVGPHGALLLGDEQHWTHAAAPGQHPRPLRTPLTRTPWGVRWRDDGRVVAGLMEHRALWVDLEAGTPLHEQANSLPLDGELRAVDARGRLPVGFRDWRLVEASCAARDSVLAGPGGACWDLVGQRRLFDHAPVALGATVSTPRGFATVHWETGAGRWLHPATGETLERFDLPLPADDPVTSGFAHGDAAVFVTAEGRQYLVDGGWVSMPPRPLPAPRRVREDLLVNSDGVRIGGYAGRPWPIPAEDARRVGDKVYAWSTDGLLAVLPGT